MEGQSATDYDAIKKSIEAIDLSQVVVRLVKNEKWRRYEAEEACQQYRRFLFLLKKYDAAGTLSPSLDIDEVWHNHILFTQQYHRDCELIFGNYLHHNPFMDPAFSALNAEAFEKTQNLHYQEYGDYIYEVRGTTFWSRLLNPLRSYITNKWLNKISTKPQLSPTLD